MITCGNVNDKGGYIAVNDRACALTGYSGTELLRKTISDLTAPNERVRSERLWDSFIGSTKQHGVYNIVRKDGPLVKVEYVAYTNLASGIHISFIRPTV
jgi:PAS domain S-box-containing protein